MLNNRPIICKKYVTLRKGPISIGGRLLLTPGYLIFKSYIGYQRFIRFDNIKAIMKTGKKIKKLNIILENGKSYDFLTSKRDNLVNIINTYKSKNV